jgi:hypothetical protein
MEENILHWMKTVPTVGMVVTELRDGLIVAEGWAPPPAPEPPTPEEASGIATWEQTGLEAKIGWHFKAGIMAITSLDITEAPQGAQTGTAVFHISDNNQVKIDWKYDNGNLEIENINIQLWPGVV